MAQSVAIAGGGIAGLIAAVDLARAGVEVSVFEAAVELGGRARTQKVGGFSFNQGAHALYAEGGFCAALRRLGVVPSGEGPKLAHASAMQDGRFERLPVSLGSLAATRLLSVSDKLALGRIQSTIRSADRQTGSFTDWLDTQRLSPRLRSRPAPCSTRSSSRLAG